ncbi:MAG TPA: type II toxin-antitoxin system VapC family toxin [Xanthobacteraceae bacterium]|nr:type II toxin-antitoxin system VapC family toxin [Xanthobacteraceae bacterium]
MRGWLLDTNILSELRKPRPEPGVRAFIETQPGDLLYVTDITFAEIRYGIDQVPQPDRRADLDRWLDMTLRPLFSGRTLAVTEDVIVRWKSLQIDGRRRGHTFSQPDLFIAAIAAHEDLVVVSRDVSEFVAAGVSVFDPWRGVGHLHGGTANLVAPVTLDALRRIRPPRR